MATNCHLLRLGLRGARGLIGCLDDCGPYNLQASHITNTRGLACSSMCHKAKLGNPHSMGTKVARILRSRLSAWALKTGALLRCFIDCTCVSRHYTARMGMVICSGPSAQGRSTCFSPGCTQAHIPWHWVLPVCCKLSRMGRLDCKHALRLGRNGCKASNVHQKHAI